MEVNYITLTYMYIYIGIIPIIPTTIPTYIILYNTCEGYM